MEPLSAPFQPMLFSRTHAGFESQSYKFCFMLQPLPRAAAAISLGVKVEAAMVADPAECSLDYPALRFDHATHRCRSQERTISTF